MQKMIAELGLEETDPHFEMQQICQLLLNKESTDKLNLQKRFENLFK